MINDVKLKPTPDNGYHCPICDGRMTFKKRTAKLAKGRKSTEANKHFYGCLSFPDCNGSRNSDGTITKNLRGAKTYFFDDNDPWESPDYDLEDNWGIELQDTF